MEKDKNIPQAIVLSVPEGVEFRILGKKNAGSAAPCVPISQKDDKQPE